MPTDDTDDDDFLTGPVPAPDSEASAAERARARTFAELIDKTLSGRTPPAMSAEDRALLEVATVIRAASGGLELAPTRQRALVEDVLRSAVGAGPTTGAGAGAGASLGGMASAVAPIARGRARRWAPWLVAGASSVIAAAAVLMLWLQPETAPSSETMPAAWRSRPSDPLIGEIPRDRAGDASGRIDQIFADRLDGYRARRLAQGGTR